MGSISSKDLLTSWQTLRKHAIWSVTLLPGPTKNAHSWETLAGKQNYLHPSSKSREMLWITKEHSRKRQCSSKHNWNSSGVPSKPPRNWFQKVVLGISSVQSPFSNKGLILLAIVKDMKFSWSRLDHVSWKVSRLVAIRPLLKYFDRHTLFNQRWIVWRDRPSHVERLNKFQAARLFSRSDHQLIAPDT